MIGRIADELEADDARDEPEVVAARQGFDGFCELVIKDDRGQRFRQSAIHRSWSSHVDYCRRVGKAPVIIAPWGHGKSNQMAIARVLWELGQDQNLRLKVVCNSDDNAMLRVLTIRNYIERDPDFRAVFPRVEPDYLRKWDKHELFVRRRTGAIDPSVQAHSVLSAGIGGRCDGIIFDDVVDRKNAVEQPALRDKVTRSVLETWMGRLEPTGWMIYIATLWHRDDLTHKFIEDPELRAAYCTLVQRIDERKHSVEMAIFGLADDNDYLAFMERTLGKEGVGR